MKKVKYFLLLFLLTLPVLVSAQEVPNADFENWSSNSPAGWWTSNNSSYSNVTQSTTAHSGSYSAKAEVLEFFGVPAFPALFTGSIGPGTFPISQSYTALTGYFQYYPSIAGLGIGPSVVINFLDEQGFIAQGSLILAEETVSSWQKFTVVMDYLSENTPTEASIQFSLSGEGNGGDVRDAIGSYYFVDNLVFETTTGITKDDYNTPTEFSLQQNFPNPFNPTTNIKFSIPEESFVNLKIYNVQGEEVATIVNDKLSAGTYQADWDASGLPSGVYVYAIRSENNFQSRKMVLMK